MFKKEEYEMANAAKALVDRKLREGLEPWEIMFDVRWDTRHHWQNCIKWRGMIASVLKAGTYDPYTGQWWMPSTKEVLRWYRQSKRAESKKGKVIVSCLDAQTGCYFNEAV